jgi:hypothetical protein
MKKQRITYFITGLLLQLSVIGVLTYWFVLLSATSVEEAIGNIASRLPSFLRDTTVIMIITAAITTLSMMCYGASRNYSLSRSFRTITVGLILIDAIILLWIILALM